MRSVLTRPPDQLAWLGLEDSDLHQPELFVV